MCEKTRSAIERQPGVAHAGFEAFGHVHAGGLIEQQQTRTSGNHRLPVVRCLDGQPSAQANVHFEQCFAGHDFLSNCVEQAIEELIEPIAWERCERVNAAELESLQTILSNWPSAQRSE